MIVTRKVFLVFRQKRFFIFLTQSNIVTLVAVSGWRIIPVIEKDHQGDWRPVVCDWRLDNLCESRLQSLVLDVPVLYKVK